MMFNPKWGERSRRRKFPLQTDRDLDFVLENLSVEDKFRRMKKILKQSKVSKQLFEPQVLPGSYEGGPMPDALPGLFDQFSKLCELPNSIEQLSDSINKFVNSDSLENAISSVKNLNLSLSELAINGIEHKHSVPSFEGTLKWLWENKTTGGLYFLLIVLVCLVVKNCSKKTIFVIVLFVSFIIYQYFGKQIKEAWQRLVSMLSDSMIEILDDGYIPPEYYEHFEPQSFSAGPLLKGLMCICFLCGMRDFESNVVTEFFEGAWSKVKSFPSRFDGLEKTFNFYSKMLQDTLNAFTDLIGVDHKFAFATDIYPDTTRLINDAEKFLNDCKEDEHLLVSNAAQMCNTFENKIQQMIMSNPDPKFYPMRQLLCETRSRLRNLATDLELRGAGKSSTRVPPIAYMFSGQPGLGKSYFMTMLTFAALGRLYKNVPAALEQIRAGQDRDFWYSANLSIQHWEGYHGQLVVQVDDAGMQKDVAGIDPEKSELNKLVRMINDSVYPLPMANLHLKGKVEFDSAVLLCTTNREHWMEIASISNPGAFARRFTGWDVSVTDKYAQKMTDGDQSWMGVKDIPELREILASEGKSEDEIDAFIRDSLFLEFRKRVTIRSKDPGYVDPKVYTTHDVVDCLLEDISKRDLKKQTKADHRKSLIEKYINFEPQARNLDCPCALCQLRYYPVVGNGTEHLFWLQDTLSMRLDPNDRLSTFVQQGWNSVTEDPAHLSQFDIPCFSEIYADPSGAPRCTPISALYSYGRWLKIARLIEERGILHNFRVARVKQFAKMLGTTIAVGASVFIVLKGMEWFFQSTIFQEKVMKRGRFVNRAGITVPFEEIEPQARDLNAREQLASTVYRNTYSITDNKNSFGYVVFVHDCVMAMPQHFLHRFDDMSPDYFCYLERIGDGVNGQRIYLEPKMLQNEHNRVYPLGKDADLVFILVDSRVLPRQATLTHKVFEKANDWRSNGEVIMPLIRRTDKVVTFYAAPYDKMSNSYQSREKNGKIVKCDGIAYTIPTAVGDCGLPVAVQDSNSTRKVFGIHVAGARGCLGMAVPITEEMIQQSILEFSRRKGYHMITAQDGHDNCVFRNPSMQWEEIEPIPEENKVPGKLNLGRVKPPKNAYTTNIRPSPLFKKVEGAPPLTKPARLRTFITKDGVEINPEDYSMAKYSHGTPLWDLEMVDMCVDNFNDNYYNNPLFSVNPAVGRGPLDYETAVKGIAGVDGFDGLKRSTSAGYPECTETDLGGKRDFFGTEGDYVFGSEREVELRASVDAEIALAKRGIRTKHACRVTLKDERRPKEKVDAGKTRSIFGAPLKHLIMSRMKFGAALHAFQHNRIRNGMCIGINVYTDADELVNYLGPDSKIIAGDFSSFDGFLPYFLMVRFTDTMDQFYRDWGTEECLARKVIFEDICNSRHVDSQGRVIEWVGSNSSGNAFTSYLNSWCNLIALRYATLRILNLNGRKAREFLAKINEHVKFAAYGDDNLIAVQQGSPYFEELTQDAYTKAFTEMGWTYTDENKSGGDIDQNRRIGDVSFLKRSFELTHPIRGRRYMMALSLQTILEMIQWKKKKDLYDEDVKRNCVNALQELSQHDREVFDRWRPAIMTACFENLGGFVPFPNTYDQCQAAVITRGTDW